ncbi:MAG TPA: enoyl-CoA hydratase/isomerase family protein [Caulobacteraceae bacterium]|nr:enoyl-CoA hydratase/isomerase family protein [Caulobacteraceae bacterium]
MAEGLSVSTVDGRILLLVLDNPPANAMSADMLAAMAEALAAGDENTDLRAVVLTAEGPSFCSGADLKAAHRNGGFDAAASFGRVLDQLAASRAPAIAAINGHCVGGGLELAACCDLRIASTEARFVAAGVNVGLMASAWRLPRLIGPARAKAMLLTGSPIDAARAERWGLVTSLHAPGELRDAALALARRIASRAPLSVEATKRMADQAALLSPEAWREAAGREMAHLLASRDHKEALAAFAGKREPAFRRA